MLARTRALVGISGPATYVFVGRVFALCFGVATALIASRLLGAEGRGTVVAFATIQLLISTALALGSGSAVYLAAARREMQIGLVAGSVIIFGGAIAILATAVASVAVLTGVFNSFLSGLPPVLILLIGPAAASQYIVVSMTQVAMGSAQARATMYMLMVAPIGLFTATACVGALGATPAFMVLAYSGAWILCAGVATILSPRPIMSSHAVRRLARLGLPAALGDVANALSYRSDFLILGALAGTSALGVYALAVQALEPLWLLAGSAAGGLLIALPSEEERTWRRTTTRSAIRVVVWTAIGALAVVALMPLFVAFVGSDFRDTPVVAFTLAPAVVLLALSKMLAVLQLVSGRLWWGTAIAWLTFVANVIACFILIPALGASGAALGSIVSYGLSALSWSFAAWQSAPRASTHAGPRSA